MGSFGLPEILVILFIVILLFGARKLPELARGLGQGIREFKKATSNTDESSNKSEKVESGKN